MHLIDNEHVTNIHVHVTNAHVQLINDNVSKNIKTQNFDGPAFSFQHFQLTHF